MKILYILKHDPWGIGGGCYACRKYLELFTTIFADARFEACICEEYLENARLGDFPNVTFIPVKPRSKISKVLTPLTGLLHRHYDTVKNLLRKNNYDYCIFDENGIAGSLVKYVSKYGVKTIVLNHNCQYEYSRDNIVSPLERILILPVVKRCECVSYINCDYNIFLTEEDQEQFAERYGHSNTKGVVGGMFYGKDETPVFEGLRPLRKASLKMVISGTMGNVQNMDGISYFLDELLPFVPEDVEVVLAGKNPPELLVEKVRLLKRNIDLVPNPEDMDAIVCDCDIFLCPARLGGGIKMRVMDGFRNGLPVLAHRVSARGYRAFEREGVMAEFETKDQFAECVDWILSAVKSGKMTRGNVLNAAERIFSFGSAVKRVSSIVKS